MTSQIIYGLSRTRISLKSSAGVSTNRYTFQVVDKEGLNLIFTPEGVPHALGSGAYFRKGWTSHGLRCELDLKWSAGLETLRETWNGSAWASPTLVTTAEAVGRVLESAMVYPCTVEPHTDHSFSFDAQPDPKAKYELTSLKGVLHVALVLKLISKEVVAIPTWLDTPAPGGGIQGTTALMLHSNLPTRIIVYDSSGNRVKRWTLQMHDKSGRTCTWAADANLSQGGLPLRRRALSFKGWRQTLKLKWAMATWATYETWSAGAWVAGGTLPMAQAAAEICSYGDVHDVQVEPFGASDDWAVFMARPYDKKFQLRDRKGVAHAALEMELESTDLLSSIFSADGAFVNGGFVEGFVS